MSAGSEWGPIDACCDRFEAAWQQGPRPTLEDFLAGTNEPAWRAKLFQCLLELDCDYRVKLGETPSADDYLQRFPEFAAVIQAELSSPDATQLLGSTGQSPGPSSLPVSERYAVQDEIARGGMGAVLRGHDHNLGRELAIKVLLAEHRDNPHIVQRFLEEARIGGQLQHPGVVPVYEMGRFSDQRPFFSMKLVKGETLTKLLSSRATSAADRPRLLGIFKQVCETLAYAHSRHVIHRDLKPGNIMVGAFGEVQVMDWGLAKVRSDQPSDTAAAEPITQIRKAADMPAALTANASRTLAGSIMGTPAYMPPEQAQGLVSLVDERADVFGLGAILCEILTGKPPYIANNQNSVFQLAQRGELRDCFARLSNCDADPELIALTRSCLGSLPDDRPRNAGIVADRITNYLTSVEARLQAAKVQQAQEAARAEEALRTAAEAESKTRAERHARKLQVGFAVSLLVLIAVAGIVAVVVAVQQNKLKQQAQSAEAKAVGAQRAEATERRRADLTVADMQASHGLIAAARDSAGESVLWFATAAEQAAARGDAERAADNLIRARNWLAQSMIPVGVVQIEDTPARLEFQPHGDHLLIQTTNAIQVHDWRNQTPLTWSLDLGQVQAAAFSPDGKLLAVGLPNETRAKRSGSATGLQLRQMPEGKIVYESADIGQVIALAFSADGKRLATAGRGLRWLDVEHQTWTNIARPQKAVRELKFNAAGDRLAAWSVDSQVRVFSLDNGNAKLLFSVAHQPGFRSPPAFISDEQTLATIQDDSLARFDMTTGEPVGGGNLRLAATTLSRVVASPDGNWLASGGYYGPEIRSTASDQTPAILLQHTNYVADLAFSPDSRSLLTASSDATSQVWSLAERRLLASLLHTSSVACCAWSSDGEYFATAQEDGLVRIWRLQTSSAETRRIADWGQRARLSHDGKLVSPGRMHESVTGSSRTESQRLQVLHANTLEPAGAEIVTSEFIADSCICQGQEIVAALLQQDEPLLGKLAAWNIATGQSLFEPISLPSSATSIAPRKSVSTEVAVLCASGDVLVFDVTQGKKLRERKLTEAAEVDGRWRLEYTPDGSSLVVLAADDLIHVLAADSLEPRFDPITPVVEGGPCRSFAISRDGRMLATAVNGKNFARVWSLADGQPLSPPLPHPGDSYGLFSVAFSPDGTRLLTGSKDGQARYWNWTEGKLAGPALTHSDEIWSVAITPDGKRALIALRGRTQTLHLWDLATGKPLAPRLVLASAGEDQLGAHTVVLSTDGSRAYSCNDGELRLIDLASLLAAPNKTAVEYKMLGQLAAGRLIEQGDVRQLSKEEWLARWDEFRAAVKDRQ